MKSKKTRKRLNKPKKLSATKTLSVRDAGIIKNVTGSASVEHLADEYEHSIALLKG